MRYVMIDYTIRTVDRIKQYEDRLKAHHEQKDAEALETMTECQITGCPECPADCFGTMFKRQAF